MINTILGEQIRNLRKSKKMTLSVMAERVGITTSAIAAYENGARTPSLDILIKIAKLFNVTIDYLIGLDDDIKVSINDLSDNDKETVINLIETLRVKNSHQKLLNHLTTEELMRLGLSMSRIDEIKNKK